MLAALRSVGSLWGSAAGFSGAPGVTGVVGAAGVSGVSVPGVPLVFHVPWVPSLQGPCDRSLKSEEP